MPVSFTPLISASKTCQDSLASTPGRFCRSACPSWLVLDREDSRKDRIRRGPKTRSKSCRGLNNARTQRRACRRWASFHSLQFCGRALHCNSGMVLAWMWPCSPVGSRGNRQSLYYLQIKCENAAKYKSSTLYISVEREIPPEY